MPHTSYFLNPDFEIDQHVDDEQLISIVANGEGVLWLDIEEPGAEDRSLLLDGLGFHPLAVEACIERGAHSVRVEGFGSYIFINVRGIDYTTKEDVLETTDLSMFVGRNYVVTAHDTFMPSVEAVRKLVVSDVKHLMSSPSLLAHAHLDALIQMVRPALERMSDHADTIEEQIIENPSESVLAGVMTLKRSCLSLNRALAPQREVLSRLGRREFGLIAKEADLYFRDLFEDLVRVQAANDIIRERTDTALATYLSVVSNRQNEFMKVLSIVATIFMPLGLVAGIFGMNFQYMPGLDFRWGYFAMWSLTLIAIALMLWLLWLKGWFSARMRALRSQRFGRFVPTAVDPIRLTVFAGRAVARNLRRRTR
ncbi:MAG: magnesium/cobalt transporter CorA [Chloroflexi bacterium]|nr:magnesium/cobalt transporter CorA [Chloroflexota bacterium]